MTVRFRDGEYNPFIGEQSKGCPFEAEFDMPRKRERWPISCAFVLSHLACGLCGLAQDVEKTGEVVYEPPVGFILIGQVLNDAGAPIPEFEYRYGFGKKVIRGEHPGPSGDLPRWTPVSHPEGKFEIRMPPITWDRLGGLTLIMGAPGYVKTFHFVEYTPEKVVPGLRVVLDKAAIVEGHIVDERGYGVQGAHIWEGGVAPAGHHGREGHIAETDYTGRFLLNRLSPGAHKFGVMHAAHPSTTFDVQLSASETNYLTLTMPTGSTLSGTMRFGDELQMDGRVGVDTREQDKGDQVTEGTFSINGIPLTETYVHFTADREESTGEESRWLIRKQIDFANEGNTREEIQFPAGTATLLGNIVRDGEGISCLLYAVLEDVPDYLQIEARSNEQGEFQISELPAGKWRISVQQYDSESGSYKYFGEISTQAGETSRLLADLVQFRP